jgi:hypothetical protein
VGNRSFAERDFERFITEDLGAHLIRPNRKDEKPRFGKLGGIRQWIESIFDTLKGPGHPGTTRGADPRRGLRKSRSQTLRPCRRDLAQLATRTPDHLDVKDLWNWVCQTSGAVPVSSVTTMSAHLSNAEQGCEIPRSTMSVT